MSEPFDPERRDAYFVETAPGVYRPTIIATGAWHADEQHLAATSALMTQVIAGHDHRDGMQIARLSFEVLGKIPLGEVRVEVQTTRPGRTIELLEAVLTVEHRPILRARAWRLAEHDTAEYEGVEFPSLPPVAECEPNHEFDLWSSNGFTTTIELRTPDAGRPGRRRGWIRTRPPLIAGQQAHPLADFMLCVDVANGLATRVDPKRLMYPNVDLTLHFFREPRPGWVGLDTRVNFGPTGLGLTSSVLSDEQGPVGMAQQSLTLRERRS